MIQAVKKRNTKIYHLENENTTLCGKRIYSEDSKTSFSNRAKLIEIGVCRNCLSIYVANMVII